MTASLARVLAAALVVAGPLSCIGPRAPAHRTPYAVRLLGASDGALRASIRGSHLAFEGSVGRDFAIEVTNDTPSHVGMTMVIDGLDALGGRPVSSCADLGGWELAADSTAIMRGFSVSSTQLASYRFAPRDRSLAAITKDARRDAIGTIEVCFFSLKPRAVPAGEARRTFEGVLESEPLPQASPVVADLLVQEDVGTSSNDNDKLLARIVVTYEDDNGAALGTAPPPAGVARVAPPPRHDDGSPAPVEPPKPGRPVKPVKPGKDPPKPPRPRSGGKPEKDWK